MYAAPASRRSTATASTRTFTRSGSSVHITHIAVLQPDVLLMHLASGPLQKDFAAVLSLIVGHQLTPAIYCRSTCEANGRSAKTKAMGPCDGLDLGNDRRSTTVCIWIRNKKSICVHPRKERCSCPDVCHDAMKHVGGLVLGNAGLMQMAIIGGNVMHAGLSQYMQVSANASTVNDCTTWQEAFCNLLSSGLILFSRTSHLRDSHLPF